MTDTVKSWIEERRAMRGYDGWTSEQIVKAGLPRALDAIEQVLEVHRRAVDIFEPSEFCAACSTDQRTAGWPCATVQAIEGAINE